MATNVITELETAAQVLLAPPSVVNSDQRKSAELLFLNFRQTKSPYVLCRHILENSSVGYVQFEAAELLKHALVHEWSLLQESDLMSLRQYLLNFVAQRQLEPFVRDRLLQVIAIMIKRGSVDDFGRDRSLILNDVESLILSGDLPRQILGCCIITSMMQEYSSTLKSADVGLTWETHFKAKKQFEATDLKRIFNFSVRTLIALMKEDIPLTANTCLLLKHLLCIAENVLTWGFISSLLPKRLIGMFESVYETDQNPSLRLDSSWRNVILDPDVLDLFFKIHWKVRSHPELLHHCLICLTQLACLNGKIFSEKELRIKYVENYVKNFLSLASRGDLLNKEAFGIANIVYKLILFFSPTVIAALPNDIQQSFLQQLARLTCMFAEGAAQEEMISSEDQLYMEAFECMLKSWVSILQECNEFPKEFYRQSAFDIFNCYLKCHISQPEGTRGQECLGDSCEEIDEAEEDDRIKFRCQLQTIGLCGQHVPNHSLPTLARLLEDRTKRLQALLQKIHGQNMTISDNNVLTSLFEDIHWLVLIAGNILMTDCEGEYPLIPSRIMSYSLEQASQVNVDKTLQTLTSLDCDITDIQGAEESADHVVRLVAAIFRVCQMENKAVSANLSHVLSPEVSRSLMWFLKSWSETYLLHVETYYSEISMAISTAFGNDTECMMWALNFLLEKIELNLNSFVGEHGVMIDTIQLFVALCSTKEKGKFLIKSDRLWNIFKFKTNLPYGTLPQVVIRSLYKGLLMAGSTLEDQQTRQEYFFQILKPLQDRFKTIVCSDNLRTLIHEESVKLEMIDLIESFIGVAQGTHVVEIVQPMFQFLYPVLSEFAALIGMFHNYQQIVELILGLYCECARSILCFLQQEETHQFYQACIQTIETYTRVNRGRVSKERSSEDDTYHDILLLLELFTLVLSKDFFELASFDDATNVDGRLTAADVCLHGLNMIMPLMTDELLKFPTLCIQYFKMITLTCEFYPQKMCDLPDQLLEKLFLSIKVGLTEYGSEVIVLCCDFIQALGNHLYSERDNNCGRAARVYNIMKPLVKLVMDLILSRQIGSELLPNMSGSLYVLICCYQDFYKEIVEEVIRSQPSPENANRLAVAFEKLTDNLPLDTTRQNKAKFKDRFDDFVVDVLGFLHIK